MTIQIRLLPEKRFCFLFVFCLWTFQLFCGCGIARKPAADINEFGIKGVYSPVSDTDVISFLAGSYKGPRGSYADTLRVLRSNILPTAPGFRQVTESFDDRRLAINIPRTDLQISVGDLLHFIVVGELVGIENCQHYPVPQDLPPIFRNKNDLKKWISNSGYNLTKCKHKAKMIMNAERERRR